ncbi:tyrosine--tRNA ligase [Gulosibacter sp. 10]|uniref:tyrosine--tRNA ligase n=1 Tax=Gulosibacter sp. 10 TaxID=1255570 RepID=UPI00097EC40B|nr:tyrosine--tRNA ligase [Gulosibacter sp. 10]SJM70313.1 Tyrosyl-tRNA synthetase [Gulosibacter sp. 10]
MTLRDLSWQKNDPSFDHILDELEWRGYIHVSTDLDELRARMDEGPITYYCGFDPTAPSLHLGHLVQLLLLRRLQLAGNNPIGLVGGSTGLIGDPRPTAERTLNSREVVAEWVEGLRGQVEWYLDFEGEHAARMANNLDWTIDLSAIDFLRDLGKHFRVGSMLKKDAVSARLNSDAGISYTEFSYQILQAYDFLQLYRNYGLEMQTGGSDQWGNLVGGVDLIRRVEGASAHALGSPLITNSDGTKFGKSEGNAIWIDAELTSAYAFYQFWLNTDDADVVDRLKVFTFFTREEIGEFAEKVQREPFRREAQRALARAVTSLVHGDEATDKAIAASEALFGQGDVWRLDGETLRSAIAELPHAEASIGDEVAQVLVATGAVDSLSAARRAIKQGGVSLNNVRVEDEHRVLGGDDLLAGRAVIVRRGKKTLVGAIVGE